MKIVGLITEYNPFHNGHLYHIEKSKELTGADFVIVVMSGNFVQRGAPAMMPKHLRAACALNSGADLVLELPVCFATGSAEFFAEGATALLDRLGCVDALCFGSECGDCNLLETAAQILAEEPEEYKCALRQSLKQGLSFPQARQTALEKYFRENPQNTSAAAGLHTDILSNILSQPNNILGIEYMKALDKRGSAIRGYSIKRMGAGYHENELSENYSSASGIRQFLSSLDQTTISVEKPRLPEYLKNQMPSSAIKIMEKAWNTRYPVYANDFSLLLKYRLLQETKQSLASYMDVSEDLANRISNLQNGFITFDDFCNALKTKDTTYSRISRSLLHILLDIRTERLENYRENGYCHYAHVLGFRKDSSRLLSLLKETSGVPILTKLTQTEALSDTGRIMLAQDIFAADLYESVISDKFRTPFIPELRQQIIKV